MIILQRRLSTAFLHHQLVHTCKRVIESQVARWLRLDFDLVSSPPLHTGFNRRYCNPNKHIDSMRQSILSQHQLAKDASSRVTYAQWRFGV
jgi:hypothetical protein